MGHDAHFLSRLDRVSWSDAELALTLYRDHELVAELIHRSSAPPQVERVAISLRDPVAGPFVIVAKSGHFVTCLAEGMKVELPVVPRPELDEITRDLASLRAAQRAYLETGREMAKRLFQHGEALFREDLPALRALQPALCSWAARAFIETSFDVHRVVPDLRRAAKHKARVAQRLLSAAMVAMWQARNLALVAGLGSPRQTLALARTLPPGISLTIAALGTEQSFVTLTAAWWMAQVGLPVLDAYLEQLRLRQSGAAIFDALTVLVALASKHPARRPEIREAVVETANDSLNASTSGCAGAALSVLDALASGDCHDATRRLALEGSVPGPPSPRAGRPRAVSADEAMPWALCAAYDMVSSPRAFEAFLRFVATAATLEAESLCLPRSLAHLHPTRLPPAECRRALAANLQRPYATPPRRRAPGTPPRNAVCPCGSGRKHKRCCGGVQSTHVRALGRAFRLPSSGAD